MLTLTVIRTLRRLCAPLVACLLLLAPGCTADSPKFKIGVSQCSDDEWRSQMNDEIRREILFHDDAEVEILTADDNNADQIRDIEYFVRHNFDLIIVSPRESKAITPAIREAYEKGIPVIVFDRAVDGPWYTSFMKLDNHGLGAAAADYIGSSTPRSNPVNVLELRGLDGSSPADERHRGFLERIDSFPDINLVSTVNARWKGEPAERYTDSLLRRYPEINLIYAHNDVMALAAARAAKRLGRRDIRILGTDAAPALGIRAVADSMIEATFIYPTEGDRVIRTAMKILHGEPYEKIDNVPARFAVDATNAPLLLRQNELLAQRTHQIEVLTDRNLLISSRHRTQQWMLYTAGAALLFLAVAVLFMVRSLRQRRRYQKELSEKNDQLRAERDRQDQLYASLEEATRSKLMFFTNVSHDLRTPLTLIAEPIEQVAEADYLTPVHKSLMQVARRNVRILRRLIEQILDFRRYQNGKARLELQPVRPLPLLEEWAESFRSVAVKRHIKYQYTFRGDREAVMALDVEKMERILFNLLSNAFKFTPDHGSITLTAGLDTANLRISVADTGIGILPDDKARIFDRFYQVDRIHPTGSGIGLSLTKAFAELMEGSITVESEPGKGSEFTVTVPVRYTATTMAETTPPAPAAPHPDHIKGVRSQIADDILTELQPTGHDGVPLDDTRPLLLVVDDNPDIIALLEDILQADYNVISAPDGKTALRLAGKYVPDLIVCDIMMPGTDGLEVTRKLKSEIPTSHIPVLMLTACKLDEQRVQSYDSGADGFISKPFSTELLLSRIASLLENRRRIYDLWEETGKPLASRRGKLPDSNDPLQVESDFYRRFMEIIARQHTVSELAVRDIADALGITSPQLTRKIKALTNLSPVDIIRDYRLRRARNLILTTDRSISEIAYEVGFSSPQYFSKCFRDAYGRSPSDLRMK